MSTGASNAIKALNESRDFLNKNSELSNAMFIGSIIPKIAIISAASEYEKRILTLLEQSASNLDNKEGLILGLVRNKAIKRQYHTYFDWDNLKIGSFQSLVGPKLSKLLNDKMNKNSVFKQSVQSFLEIGGYRNILVHSDFLSCPINLSIDAVGIKINEANNFVVWLESEIGSAYRVT